MRIASLLLLTGFVAAAAASPMVAATRGHHKAGGVKSSSKHSPKPKLIGQRAIDDERAAQLQAALVKAGYLSGEPSGHWDSATEAAMSKMQAANGWQTKLVPDSRAIIKLGLGPNTASSSAPQTPAATLGGSITASQLGLVSVR